MRSAWPLWRAYSSIRWTRIQRRLWRRDGSCRKVRRDRPSSAPGCASASWRIRSRGRDRLVVQPPELVGGVLGGRVELPVTVGLPVDRGPRLGGRVVGVDLVDPPVLDVGQVLEQATERDRRRRQPLVETGRVETLGLHAQRVAVEVQERQQRLGLASGVRRVSAGHGWSSSSSGSGLLRRRLIQIVSASSTNGPKASTSVSHRSTGCSGPRWSRVSKGSTTTGLLSPCAGSGGPWAARRSP